MPLARWTFVKVFVRDLEAMIGFYEAAFEFKVEVRVDGDEFEEVLLRQADEASLFGLLQWKDDRLQGQRPAVGIIGLVTDDIDAAVARALECGASLIHGPLQVPGSKVAFLTDIEGNEIEFVQFG